MGGSARGPGQEAREGPRHTQKNQFWWVFVGAGWAKSHQSQLDATPLFYPRRGHYSGTGLMGASVWGPTHKKISFGGFPRGWEGQKVTKASFGDFLASPPPGKATKADFSECGAPHRGTGEARP